MAVEIFIVSIYALFCITNNPKRIILSIFLLLPIHGFVKFALFPDSGSIFSIWKEIGILIALFKLRSVKAVPTQLHRAVFGFVALVLFFAIIGIVGHLSFMGDVRKYIFAIPLLYVVQKIDYTRADVKKLISCILFGSAVINFTGVVDFLSPEIRLIMRTIMGAEFQIAADGTVYYDISSYKIMGLDRVCGFMGGGPNMMGVFNASVFLLSVYSYVNRLYVQKLEKLLFYLALALCVFCLILSFSRAGWALVFITFFYVAMSMPKYRKTAIAAGLVGLFLGVIFYFTVESVQTVVDGTLSGNEASSAERGNMTRASWKYLLENPFGYGLGATDNVSDNFVYFAESTMINMGIATGILGVFLYSYLIFSIYKLAKRNRYNSFYLIAPGFIFAYYITAWVSVNVVENPFLYYAWLIFGLGLNKNLRCKCQKETRNTL